MIKLRRFLSILIIIVLVWLAAGCASKPVIYKTTMRVSPSANPPSDFLKEDPAFSYVIPFKNDSFKGTVNIKNEAERRNAYRLLCFSDFRQTKLVVDKETDLVPKLTLRSDEQRILPFSAKVGQGSHDFVLVAMEDVPVRDIESLNSGLNDYVAGNRLYLDGSSPSDARILEPLTTVPGSKVSRIVEVAASGDNLNVTIDAAQNGTVKMALIVLVDFKQSGTYLVDTNKRVVRISIPKPSDEGVLSILCIEEPLDKSLPGLTNAAILQSNRLVLKPAGSR